MSNRKKVNHQIIERTDKGPMVYKIMDELIRKHHDHLCDAKIVIAWRFGWNEDDDGNIRLGQCRKASDIDRDLHNFDFIILLNSEAWNASNFSEAQMKALIDHELCHAEVSRDEDGEVKIDEHGNTVYRVRKHDIEEFQEIVARHGCWKHELRAFAEAALERAKSPLLAQAS